MEAHPGAVEAHPGAWLAHPKDHSCLTCTANNFGLMYFDKRISQNSFSNFIFIIPKSFMVFCQELHNSKRNDENQI
jgi:hypothetical protein